MRVACAPASALTHAGARDFDIVLYGPPTTSTQISVGRRIHRVIKGQNLAPVPRAWDLLSIALSVVAADLNFRRDHSPDGWTRQIDLHIAVHEPEFWTSQVPLLQEQLRFLTTDVWSLTFFEGAAPSPLGTQLTYPKQDSVVLLSGGLDSLIGAIDIVSAIGGNPYAVSQVSQGDKRTQQLFASMIGGGLKHLQLNHNTSYLGQAERSQRARSLVFLAYAVLAATSLAHHLEGGEVPLFICENGFISLNPPLTGSRLGSLSTRTTHPVFLRLFQEVLHAAELRVRLETPYQFATKGEMLRNCKDQELLRETAPRSTSCGRYARHGYRHCGRCLPCLIRRAAFHGSGVPDATQYVYADLSRDDLSHARYDDVRSAAMAVAEAAAQGTAEWTRRAVNHSMLDDPAPYADVVERGIRELSEFLGAAGVT